MALFQSGSSDQWGGFSCKSSRFLILLSSDNPRVVQSARYTPSPVREGPEMWLASLRTQPERRVHRWERAAEEEEGLSWASPSVRERMRVAAASPRLSPQRAASKGRHTSGLRALKAPKPETMKRERRSAPQTMTWRNVESSASRWEARRRAWLPEIQALLTTMGVRWRCKCCATAVAASLSATRWRGMWGSSVASRRCTLPLVVARMKSTAGSSSVMPPSAAASWTERATNCSNRVSV